MLRMNTSLLYGSLLNTFNTHIDVSYSILAGLSGTKVTTAFHASSAASAQHFPSQTKSSCVECVAKTPLFTLIPHT
jgi:hypothetical protein